MMDTRIVSWALGIWASVTFLLCVVYGVIAPENLHAQALLEQLLPAFQWRTWPGFLLGLAESFLYGAYAGLVFCPVYNCLNRPPGIHMLSTTLFGPRYGKTMAKEAKLPRKQFDIERIL